MEKKFYVLKTKLGYLAKYTDLQTAKKTDGVIVRDSNTKGNFCEWVIRNYGIQRDVAIEIATKTQTDSSDDWVVIRVNNSGNALEIYLGNYHFYINAIAEVKYDKKELTDNEKIALVFDAVKDLVLYKNTNYGSAALHPDNVFYKGDSQNSIKIRLDDKLKRIKNGSDDEKVNDLCDLMGYEALLLVDKMKKQDVISMINKEKD